MTAGNALFNNAIAAFQAGRLDEAERHFKKLLAREPRNLAALNILGVLLASQHKYAQAEPYLREALRINAGSDATLYNYGTVLKGLGRSHDALDSFSKALAINPGAADTWNNRGIVYNGLERYAEAMADFDRALALTANPGIYCNKARSLHGLNRPQEALAAYDKALALSADLAEAWIGRGHVLLAVDHAADALESYSRGSMLAPTISEAWIGQGRAQMKLRRHEQAAASFGQALALQPGHVEAELGRANALRALRRFDEALAEYDRILAQDPQSPAAWLGRGNVHYERLKFEEAHAAYAKAAALSPGDPDVWIGCGNALVGQDHLDEAAAAFDKALALNPSWAQAWVGHGNVLIGQRRFDEALAAFDKALQIKPDLPEAWAGRGTVLYETRHNEQAMAAYDRAIELMPEMAGAWVGRGHILAFNDYREALIAFDKALQINPKLKFVPGMRLHVKQQICDWAGLEAEWRAVIEAVHSGEVATAPFAVLSAPASAADQIKSAEIYTDDQCRRYTARFWQGERYSHERIRVAYLSQDFREHAISRLLARLFEVHDRARFEIIALSSGSDDTSDMRARLKRTFDRFIDVDQLSDHDLARLIREQEIDILVDLGGFTFGSRAGVLALRPAPIQVTFLSYPGLMGGHQVDYILADRFVIPTEHFPLLQPSVVHLPDSYLTYDTTQTIADATPSRAEAGLPERGFVFCAYNNTFKITPGDFDVWMRLLQRVPESTLWLSGAKPAAVDNLRREASLRGVDPDRLRFAAYVKGTEDHLARYRLADLFLDTQPFNAQTTACDALWAGLPVLTRLGETFVGRAAASLLHALELPELVTHSAQEYEELALALAEDRARLTAIREKLRQHRTTAPLFDSIKYARDIETAYIKMMERHQAGLPPDHLVVPGHS